MTNSKSFNEALKATSSDMYEVYSTGRHLEGVTFDTDSNCRYVLDMFSNFLECSSVYPSPKDVIVEVNVILNDLRDSLMDILTTEDEMDNEFKLINSIYDIVREFWLEWKDYSDLEESPLVVLAAILKNSLPKVKSYHWERGKVILECIDGKTYEVNV